MFLQLEGAIYTILFVGASSFFNFHQVTYRFVHDFGVSNFISGRLADIPPGVNYENLIGQVDLSQVHVVEHRLGACCPHLPVTGMAKQSDADYDMAFEGELFLCLYKRIAKACASAEGDDFVVLNHGLMALVLNARQR